MEEYKIIESKRKTIAIEITGEGNITVRSPIGVTKKYINNIVEKHKDWIYEKLYKAREKRKNIEKTFIDGEKFPYLGTYYKLQIVSSEKPLIFKEEFFLSIKSVLKGKELFVKWYRKKAREIITERVDYYSTIMELKYDKIKITGAMKRWGSCSSKGNLNFAWRLVMAPIDIIDYVVVHELSHIVHRNHSKRFWEQVETIFPDYKIKRKWLKEYGYTMVL